MDLMGLRARANRLSFFFTITLLRTYLENLGVVGAPLIGPVGLEVHAFLQEPLHPSSSAVRVCCVCVQKCICVCKCIVGAGCHTDCLITLLGSVDHGPPSQRQGVRAPKRPTQGGRRIAAINSCLPNCTRPVEARRELPARPKTPRGVRIRPCPAQDSPARSRATAGFGQGDVSASRSRPTARGRPVVVGSTNGGGPSPFSGFWPPLL